MFSTWNKKKKIWGIFPGKFQFLNTCALRPHDECTHAVCRVGSRECCVVSVQWSKVGPPAFMYQPVRVFASRKAIKAYLYERVLRVSDYSAISVAPEA